MSGPVEIEGEVVVQKLGKLSIEVTQSVRLCMQRIAIMLQAYIKSDKLEGQVLAHRTGKLTGSIRQTVEETNEQISAIVLGGGGVAAYGRVHEYGGTFTIPDHQSVSRLGKSFMVKSHQATFPQRSFMRSALADRHDEFLQMIQNSVKQGIAK